MIGKIGRYIVLISSILIGIYATLMSIIECYNLFSGAFLFGQYQVQNFFYYFMKLIIYLIVIFSSVVGVLFFFKRNIVIIDTLLPILSLSTLVVGLISATVSLFLGQREICVILFDFLVPLINGIGVVLIVFDKYLNKAMKSE